MTWEEEGTGLPVLGLLDSSPHFPPQPNSYLEREASSVYVVSEKEVVHGVDIASLALSWRLIPCEKSHQVQELSVDVAIDLEGGSALDEHALALKYLLDFFAEAHDLVAVNSAEITNKLHTTSTTGLSGRFPIGRAEESVDYLGRKVGGICIRLIPVKVDSNSRFFV